ncbi:rhodanese-like domain-containing protein [Flavicella sediminum]|uniref:rhodanese-like domain-containing protein n=1 Tax=Flavicella sediminum TaxID=2585141 RepID=UPI001120E8B3|nr:rhodanese-like domain-containing protein [Flavicella sediminum]
MNIKLIFLFLFLSSLSTKAQNGLKELLQKHNSESIPYISVEELAKEDKNNFLLLDAREKKEFDTSHIEQAIFVGYDYFKLRKTKKLLKDKDQKIVVYCSLGIRSEDIAEKLKKAGYTNVYNLYGGIFEWKNQSKKVIDSENQATNKVHTFSKEWSQWLLKGEKIYEH